jgi:putative flippase GtrA
MRPVKNHGYAGSIVPELIRYALASAIALGADIALLWALVNRAGWFYVPASIASFIIGAGVAYLLSVRFVFRYRHVRSRSLEFGSFLSLGVAGLLVNTAALAIAVSAVGLGIITAKLLAAGCTFATNFTLRRQLLFSPPELSQ